MSDSGVECAPAHGELRRSGRGGVRWPWMIVGVGLALVKANAAADLVHHRTGLIVALAAALAVSVLRTRPVGIALSGAPLLAFALAPGSTALGIALGFGAFVLLLALFVAIGTVLQARQAHDRKDVS